MLYEVITVLALMMVCGTPARAQQGGDWRAAFAAGEAAREAGDYASYARGMASAVAAMPEGLGNRPFAEYHAARAGALLGDRASALRYLGMIWEEGIESLMLTFAYNFV